MSCPVSVFCSSAFMRAGAGQALAFQTWPLGQWGSGAAWVSSPTAKTSHTDLLLLPPPLMLCAQPCLGLHGCHTAVDDSINVLSFFLVAVTWHKWRAGRRGGGRGRNLVSWVLGPFRFQSRGLRTGPSELRVSLEK